MKVSDYIAKFLARQGVCAVFELSGGMITRMLDSIAQLTEIRIVSMHHEQAAAFAADASGRVLKNVPGIAFATSGPGATNLLTGIGNCYFDSIPAVFITGQVNTHEQKGERMIRQLGFQETDIVSMARPITKKAFLVNNAADIPAVLEEAFTLALSGRPGPVLIDIPMNVQGMDIVVEEPFSLSYPKPELNIKDESLLLTTKIKAARRPLILAGGGVARAGAEVLFNEFVAKTKVPVVSSLLGLDVIPYRHPLRVGFIGSYGNRWANKAIGLCDLLIVIGSRLDIRQTGADAKFFEKDREIIHVDIDEAEINNRVKGCHQVVSEVSSFLSAVNQALEIENFSEKEEWMQEIKNLKEEWKDTNELKDLPGINPNEFLHKLSQKSAVAKVFLADVGNHQMWAAQSLEIEAGQQFITSGGMGAMGYALPAAIGASVLLNDAPVVAIIGDGCMQINIQELQTIFRNKLPVKIIVFNNQSLGMIRQFQDSYFDSRYQSTYVGYSAPDFAKVAAAYGIMSVTIKDPVEVEEAIGKLWEFPDQPFLLQVMIDLKANAYPKIAFGKPITEMEPFVKPDEMEGT